MGVAQAQCKDFIKAEASLKSAITVLEARKSTVSKMDSSDNMAKELAELDMLVKEINARIVDHKEMEKGTYLEEKEFVPAFKGCYASFNIFTWFNFFVQVLLMKFQLLSLG